MKNIYIPLIFIFLSIILFVLFKYKDNYVKFLPPIQIDQDVHKFYILNTPLDPLDSPLKEYKQDGLLPKLFIYDQKYFCPVRDQKDCGACWAFVITSLLSDGITIRIIKFGKNLSVQELLTCYPDKNGCEGEKPESVLKWLENSRFKISINDYYTPEDRGNCIKWFNEGIQVEKGSLISLCKYLKYESDKNEKDKDILNQNIYNMKKQIMKYGPIYATISIYSDFTTFSGDGVYKKTSNILLGGHALEIVGWCDEGIDLRKNYTEGYWLCKNSWGRDWCKKSDYRGFVAIRMGYNECGIESRCGSAFPNVEYLLRNKGVVGNLAFTDYNDYIINVIKNKNKYNYNF